MIENFKKPLKIEFVNTSNKVKSFVPYRENSKFPIMPNGKISFYAQTSEEAIYYTKQKTAGFNGKEVETSTIITPGKYNAVSNTFSEGASFNIVYEGSSENSSAYAVVGKLPYSAITPEIGQPAGNRFTVKVVNPSITSRDQLPSGKICVVDVEGGSHNEYTKSAFENDGSLVVIINPEPESTLTLKIEWVDDVESNYVFTFEDVELGVEGEEIPDIEDIEINLPENITLTNVCEHQISFIPYKQNFDKVIEANDSLELTCESNEEVMYYLLQANKNLKVEL